MVLSTTTQFIEKAIFIHEDEYDYSLVDYKTSQIKIKIICKKHGVFEQSPAWHLSGGGCRICSYEKRGIEKRRRYGNCFVKKANEVHGGRYGYDLVNYIDSKNPVIITCLKHGDFLQTPNSHIQGCGCKLCKADISSKIFLSNVNDFVIKANLVHKNKYNYSETIYRGNKIKVKIICPIHGEFSQTPNRHLSGDGCPHCKDSHGERIISMILEKYNIEYVREKKFPKCKIKRCLKFDFFIPIYNLIIEYHGKQHFAPYERFGGLKCFMVQKRNDEYKKRWGIENGYVFKEFNYKNSAKFIENDIKKWLVRTLPQ